MRIFTLGVAVAFLLAGCAPGTSLFYMDKKNPSQFTPEEMAGFERLELFPFCNIVTAHAASYTAADKKIVVPMLRARGMTSRDIELILDDSYGTGMTWHGLTCAYGGEPSVNSAFYPGVGHQWQAVLGADYVYLRGNGKPDGMRVYAWN